MVDNLNSFTESLAQDGPEITGNLRGILEENRSSLKSSVDNLDRSLAKLDRTMDNVESISGKIEKERAPSASWSTMSKRSTS